MSPIRATWFRFLFFPLYVTLFKYLSHRFYKGIFFFLSASWIEFPWHWTQYIIYRASTYVAAQTLIIYRQPLSWVCFRDQKRREQFKKQERRWNVFYSLVTRVVMSAAAGTVSEIPPYCIQHWDTHSQFHYYVGLSRHSWLYWREERQRGTDTRDNRERVVENCRNRYALPIKVHCVLLPDRCFLSVPVRPADCSLLPIVVCRQWGHEDAFISFSWNFLLMSSLSPRPLLTLVATQFWWWLGCYHSVSYIWLSYMYTDTRDII